MSFGETTALPFLGPLDDWLLRDMQSKDSKSLAETGRIGQRMIKDFARRAYRIDLFLLPFFKNEEYEKLRNCQAKTDALIVASIPLQFLDRRTFPDCNLNIFVNRQGLQDIHFLLIECGYTFVSPCHHSFERARSHFAWCFDNQVLLPLHIECPGAVAAYNYQNGGSGRTVVLTATAFNPLQALLTIGFSCMLNVITYAHAISLYPRATFVDRVAYVAPSQCTIPGSYMSLLQAKYLARGWTVISREKAIRRREFSNIRRVGDRFSWVMPLRHRSPPPKDPKSDPIFMHTWRLAGPSDKNNTLSFIVTKPPSFKSDVCFCGWRKNIMNKYWGKSRLDSAKLIEMGKAIVPSGHWETTATEEDYIIYENSETTN